MFEIFKKGFKFFKKFVVIRTGFYDSCYYKL